MVEIYSPHATWSKVKSAAQGANVLIYLGHGNGYPSPYGAFNAKTKDGMGLNSSDGSSSHTYYGEYYIDRDIQLANERRRDPQPAVLRVGQQRVGRGLPRRSRPRSSGSTTTARASSGRTPRPSSPRASTAPRTSSTACSRPTGRCAQIFWSDPARDGRWDFSFPSSRTPGYRAWMDPLDGSNRYYRSVIGNLDLTATKWRRSSGWSDRPGRQGSRRAA